MAIQVGIVVLLALACCMLALPTHIEAQNDGSMSEDHIIPEGTSTDDQRSIDSDISPTSDDSSVTDVDVSDQRDDRKPIKELPDAEPDQSLVKGDTDDMRGEVSLQLEIPLKGKHISLDLRRNLEMPDSIPVYVGTDRFAHVELKKGLSDIIMYQDVAKHASFIRWGLAKNSTDRGMMGLFEDDGETFTVELKSRSPTASVDLIYSFDSEAEKTFTLDEQTYTVRLVEGEILAKDAVIIRNIPSAEDPQSEEDTVTRRKKRSFHNYEVELFLIIDYSIFKKWERNSRSFYYRDREQDALDDIRYYFAHVLNGMDVRYKTIREYDFEVTIRPVGMYIAKTHSASFWTEYNSEAGAYVEAYRALDDLQVWINSDANKLPSFDQVSLFTAYELYEGYVSGRRRTFSGIADIPSVCGPLRASISYDKGIFTSIQTGTHELGHALGSLHDGYDNSCSGRDQYIMANSPGQITAGNMDNLLRFSRCSIQDIREHMRRLNSKGDNCLLHRDNYNADHNYLNYISQLPGQRYTADDQCKFALGSQSYYCGGGHLDNSICFRMYCYDTYMRRCAYSPEQRPADGTMCGKQKWCVSGQCVYDSRAPHTDRDSCFYGDFKGVVKDSGKDFMCKYIESHMCYDELRYSKCCETCAKLKDSDNPDCEYGDRERDYCYRIQPADCYDSNIRRRCCSTCERLKRDDPQCEFGDKSAFCRDVLAYQCYSVNTTCCESCKRHLISKPGCEYGNRVQWCNNYPSRSCYQDSFKHQCCESCCRSKTGTANCSWGNRYSSCSASECRDPSRWDDCCYTCASAALDGCQDNASSRSWCAARRPMDCYDSYTARTCCRTCRNHHTGHSSCPYGDRFSWCGQQHCRMDARYCCSSCPTHDTC